MRLKLPAMYAPDSVFNVPCVIASGAKQSTVLERSLGILCSLIATLVTLARNDNWNLS
ncbi:MAG: hypothetical protein K2N54_07685 [Helicobacter sp.]|nr:hypothetical protein [Helicobacter sp.]